MTQPHYSPDLVPSDLWFVPQLKSPLKGKRFQTISEIQENTTGQLMVIGRIMWGPKVPTLRRTEVSLSYVQCFLYFASSSISISILHTTCLETFWTDPHIHISNHYVVHLNLIQSNLFKKPNGAAIVSYTNAKIWIWSLNLQPNKKLSQNGS